MKQSNDQKEEIEKLVMKYYENERYVTQLDKSHESIAKNNQESCTTIKEYRHQIKLLQKDEGSS